MLIKRYAYPQLKRLQTPAGRQYVGDDAEPVPSVTTILDSTADKTHLIEWRNRVGEEEANRQSQQSAGLGYQSSQCIRKVYSR